VLCNSAPAPTSNTQPTTRLGPAPPPQEALPRAPPAQELGADGRLPTDALRALFELQAASQGGPADPGHEISQ
jgi:hypothetical protein